jgi:hypothetical protein
MFPAVKTACDLGRLPIGLVAVCHVTGGCLQVGRINCRFYFGTLRGSIIPWFLPFEVQFFEGTYGEGMEISILSPADGNWIRMPK